MSEIIATVVIPTYKRPQAVHRAVLSVLAQTCPSIEIIVVDDNGKDTALQKETEALLRSFIESGKIRCLINDKNRGGSYSRNQGLNNAHGQFITFLDDDDEIDPNKIQKQVDCLNERGEKYVACHCCYHKIHPNGHIYKSRETIEGDVYYYALSKAIDLGSGSNLLMRTSRAKQIGGYDISFKRNQDLEFMTRLLKGYKLAYIPDDLLTVHHEVRDFKLTYQMTIKIDAHYLSFFSNEIRALPKRAQNRLYKRIALERFRSAVFFHEIPDGITNLIHHHVGPILFIRYCFYVIDNMITKRPYAFKIKP